MIFKEMNIKHPLYVAILSNGVVIQVYGDIAVGDDGRRYRHIGEEIDGEYRTLGWQCED